MKRGGAAATAAVVTVALACTLAAAPGSAAGRPVALGLRGSLPAPVTHRPEPVFDATALRHFDVPPAETNPVDWTEDEVSQVITDYALQRGHPPSASGVPDSVVTDLPQSAEGYLADASEADGGLVIRIDEGTRLLGWEQVPLLSTRELTVRADATGRLEVVHDRPENGGDLWDVRGLSAVRSGPVLVIGDADRGSLAGLAAVGVSAVRQASGLWGRDWDQRLVIVAPRTLQEFADQLGEPPGVARGFAAVTTGHASRQKGQAPPEQEFVGSRVIVNPDAWQDMTKSGRLFVLSHEATHVAAQGASRPRPPDWLAEGVADEVGARASGLAEAQLASPILDRVRTYGPPRALPTAQDFSGGDADVGALAYAGALVAVLLIERTYGRAALVRFFHDVTFATRAGVAQDLATAVSMRDDLGTTPAAFTRAWRSELRRLAAH